MASVHKFVLVSRFAPVTLSSSGAVVSEAQPDTNQTTASTLTMIFMGLLSASLGRLSLSFCASRVGFGNRVYQCDLGPRYVAVHSIAATPTPSRPSRPADLSASAVHLHHILAQRALTVATAVEHVAPCVFLYLDAARIAHHRHLIHDED